MSKREKYFSIGITAIVVLEVVRHYTWHKPGTPSEKAFVSIGMNPYASVKRRA